LYESRAIARYIATKYAAQGTQLIPSTDDLRAYALYDQASSVEMADFDKFAIDILRELVFKP
jgi:glutathione S-transferase